MSVTDITICPEHNKPLRTLPSGDKFCPTKNPDGSWCSFRVKMPKPAAARGAAAPTTAAAPAADPKLMLMVAALELAGRVYQGSGPVGAEDACALAATAYETALARVSQ